MNDHLQALLHSAQTTRDTADAVRSFLALCGGSATAEDIKRFIRPTNATRFDELLHNLRNQVHAIVLEPDECRYLLQRGRWNLAYRDFPLDLLRTFDHGPSLAKALADSDASVKNLTPSSPAPIDPRIIDSRKTPNLDPIDLDLLAREFWGVVGDHEKQGRSAQYFRGQLLQAPGRVQNVLKNYRAAKPWTYPGHNPGAWMNRALRNAL